jgi:hypothetical protein
MDQETLERLMLDDSLGALSDDIRTLLAERIGPAAGPAAARAARYRRTVDEARAALARPERAALPPFPAARLMREAGALRRRRLVGRIAALAAGLVLGLGIGFIAFGRAAAPAPGPTPVSVAQADPEDAAPVPLPVQAAQVAALPPGPAPEAVTEFWSLRRLAARAMAARSQIPVKVTWVSPVEQPRIGG